MNFDTLFPDNREEGETLTRQCQLVMLRMLKILDYLCSKHDIKYFLTGGTMLGAVRHQGFIPWDDDLDVGMTRTNYEKFVKYAAPALPNDIFFQTDETDVFYPSAHIMEAKLRDKYSRYSSKAKKWHYGLQIDISIYDRAYLPHNYFIYILNRFLKIYYKQKDRKRAEILKRIAKYSPIPLVYSCSFMHKREMVKLGTNFIRAKEISTLIKTRFEDIETYIPAGYHGYLKRRYGNYMELPPIDRQKGHHSNPIEQSKEADDIYKPDPFTPCNHSEILHWKDRKNTVLQSSNNKL